MPSFATRHNLDVIEDAWRRWQADPGSVDPTWQAFFEGFELGGRQAPSDDDAARQTELVRLVFGYRDLGHFQAHLDPLNPPPPPHPLLDLSEFGFTDADLGRRFTATPFIGLPACTLGEMLEALKETYCRTIGVEYMHIQDRRIRRWLQERMEPRRNRPNLPMRQKLQVLMGLHYAELFEHFLQKRYQGQKRFSLEGAETLLPLMEALIEKAAELGGKEVVIGMPHRGRLNVLANILHKPYQEIFGEFEDNFIPGSFDGDGDVKYHLGFSHDHVTARGQRVHLSLTPNPSHLEAVNPVVEGRVRAKQERFHDSDRKAGIPLLIHGDAAFAGQGLVPETLNLSNLSGYRTGGTVHVIVNNQIGFTTSPVDGRSTTYCTDVAKMIQAPIFHVNGDDPEAVVFVAELAMEFRQHFNRDVLIDMYCYRRHGHNETDDPSVTHPLMYAQIKARPSVSAVYTQQLLKQGDLQPDEAQAIDREFQDRLNAAQLEVKEGPARARDMHGFADNRWKHLHRRYSHAPVVTGVPYETLVAIGEATSRVPEGFQLHPTIAKLLESRNQAVAGRQPVNWSLAESLAFGSLLLEKTPVRLSGQDSRRGTFSQRHTVLFDTASNEAYIPLNHLGDDQATLQVYDSLLSEAAVLGFEFGYSLDDPDTLVLWEAQFGDFANGAQVIIDQFLVCSESKWQRASGLMLLLPHGYEGQGPEHSSARLERFLQLAAEDNIQVCNLTTPAQYFHLLRRQMKRDFRKPLVLMTPKSLLRHKQAVSPIEALTTGSFREVLDDPAEGVADARRVLLCSGKIYYDLAERRRELGRRDVAIVRVEQLYPLNEELLRQTLGRFRKAREWVWVQEESQNMGAWTFMEPRLRAMGFDPQCVSRDASASPATGSHHVHDHEQKELVEAALAGGVPHLVRANGAVAHARPHEGNGFESDAKRPAMSPTS